MAYAALLSVAQVIERILPNEQDYDFICRKEQMESLHRKVVSLQQLLQDNYKKCSSIIDQLEIRIVDISYQIEDMIESNISNSPFTESATDDTLSTFRSHIDKLDSIIEEAMKMKEISKDKDRMDRGPPHTTYPSRDALGINDTKVELQNDLTLILERAKGNENTFKIIPIVGMGGIGKTTLARSVFENQLIVQHFDVRSWATVSQKYHIQEILKGFLPAEKGTDQNSVQQPTEMLILNVYQSLIGRRFLIVLDDMWHVEAWHAVKRAFPNENTGSCIIITTRLSNLAADVDSSSPLHQMQFMNEDQSWELFCKKAYEHEICFEEIGKTISKKCKGLPLAIVVIAGLLKSNKAQYYWQEVARNISVAASKHDDELTAILSLSYTNLPPHLKPCFLYMGAFPEDYEINRKKLIMLLVAEGIIKTIESKSNEDMAEEYLEDLVYRNLVSVAKKRRNGIIKTLTIHDAMRELSIKKAQEVNFLQYSTHGYVMKNPRRIIFPSGEEYVPASEYLFSVRSIIYTCRHHNRIPFCSSSSPPRRLRVLDRVVIVADPNMFSHISKLSNLRYLHVIISVPSHDSVTTIPESISKLQNLETLIFGSTFEYHDLILPSSIWEMAQLKHIFLIEYTTLGLPLPDQTDCVLDKLQTLSRVIDMKFTKAMIKRIPNLKKLKVKYTSQEYSFGWKDNCLNNLADLHKLEELSISFSWSNECYTDDQLRVMNLAFPQKLKKLTLGYTNFPWVEMSLIGSLPNLQVLKLLDKSFIGEEWEPIEGQFLQLKYLKMSGIWDLERWRAESTHFPCLQTLIIKRCDNLEEVPVSIGEIPTLQKCIARECFERVNNSVRIIQEEQESYENYELQIVIEDPLSASGRKIYQSV